MHSNPSAAPVAGWPPPPTAVALKMVRRKFATRAFDEIRVYGLIEAAGGAGCPHLTRLLEAFPSEGRVCLVFPLHGRDITEAIASRMAPAEVKSVTAQLLQGLVILHGLGLVHTDVKPANVLYDPASGIAKLADLGQAARVLTQGEPVATGDYMPPEAILGTPMAAPIDLWSLGCTVYELLTGVLLFDPWAACQRKYQEFAQPDEEEHGGADEGFEGVTAGMVVGGKYVLNSCLGEGRFGTVWNATPLHNRPVPKPPPLEFLAEAQTSQAAGGPTPRWDLCQVTVAYEHLLQMVELLGPVPASLLGGNWQSLFCHADGSLRFDPSLPPRSLSQRLADHLPEHEAAAAAGFLGTLLQWEPAARPTARQALQAPWLER